jgi:hypothetical protein
MILPSKKVLSLFILVTALVSSIIIAFGKEKSSTAINFASNLVAGDKIAVSENPDWQKELSQVATPIDVSNSTDSDQTVTDTVSTTFLSNYLALKQTDKLNQESAQKLIDQTIGFIEQNSNANTNNIKLNIIADNGTQTIIEYGENLGNILRFNKPVVVKNEIEIITKFLETRDKSKTEELNSVISVYQNLTDDLIKMRVPKTFVKAHTDLVKGSQGITLALKEIQNVFDDPVKGLAYMQLYGDSANVLSQSLRATHNFIIQNKIIYKQGSGGYYLLYGI